VRQERAIRAAWGFALLKERAHKKDRPRSIETSELELEPPEKSADLNCPPLSRWPIANQAGLPELSSSEK
jgi:hypothetical protein